MPFNLRGLLQDEEFLVAAGLLSAGSQGQNIGQAAFPALIQAGKTASFFDTAQAKRNKNEALEKLLSSDQVSDIDKLYISAGVTPPKKDKTSKRTLSDEALAVFDKLKNADDFDAVFKNLNQTEKDIYNSKIKPDQSLTKQLLESAIKKKKDETSVDFSSYSFTDKGNKSGYTSVEEYVNAAKEKNPDASIEQIIQALIEQEIIIGG